MSTAFSFSSFFQSLWDRDPFPWQSMLADRVASGKWPKALDLPTASGKTACIDIAVYALAMQAELPVEQRTAPRRIWFVVDRRIVVDEAYARAEGIATALVEAAEARQGILGEIASRLLQISGTTRPLAIARLRGGIFRDDGWARLPSQPAVITSTVDQLGSRLLFRGYGRSRLAAPVFAGLAANDSMIFLDEAHCSVPFLQTLRAIETYRGPRWAEKNVPTPFSFTIVSATPPPDVPPESVFPGAERDKALDNPILQQRLHASKLATLIAVKTTATTGADPLIEKASDQAMTYLKSGRRRVAMMLNHVRSAMNADILLRERLGDTAEVVLLTGRMRPFDRDRLVARWQPYLQAAAPRDPLKPIVFVTTQCLEVGADFSFDALVTECASLDALRQRFGRLDRMGIAGVSSAAILIRSRDCDPEKSEPDPIYGGALAQSWHLLKEKAQSDIVDFGVAALSATLDDIQDLTPYLAPVSDAPVLLPAHLDLLCQTSQPVHPEPDVQLFLHGKDRGAPEVQVVWRTDLSPSETQTWAETAALCPPVSAEMLSIPLYQFRRFLEQTESQDAPDVEGMKVEPEEEAGASTRPCLVWNGRDRSKVVRGVDDIAPADVIIVPAAYGMSGLGQAGAEAALGVEALDIWESAIEVSARPLALRIHRAVLAPWQGCPPVADLVRVAEQPNASREELDDAIDAVLSYEQSTEDSSLPSEWWLERLRRVRNGRIETHPGSGVVLMQRGSRKDLRCSEPDLFADDDDLTSLSGEPVSLDEHSELVRRTVAKLADRCLPEEYRNALEHAAWWHDSGKLDDRFQIFLHQGDELAALRSEKPLAKSAEIPTTPARRRTIRETSGLPDNFRHEILSVQIAARYANGSEGASDLFLHLIGSHHGYGRPFAPVCVDSQPPAVEGMLGDTRIALAAQDRAQLVQPHRLDSGVAERFWKLVRRYGWWGLAYFETLLRLGDWYASGLRLDEVSRGEDERD